jgi:hypothetical protein
MHSMVRNSISFWAAILPLSSFQWFLAGLSGSLGISSRSHQNEMNEKIVVQLLFKVHTVRRAMNWANATPINFPFKCKRSCARRWERSDALLQQSCLALQWLQCVTQNMVRSWRQVQGCTHLLANLMIYCIANLTHHSCCVGDRCPLPHTLCECIPLGTRFCMLLLLFLEDGALLECLEAYIIQCAYFLVLVRNLQRIHALSASFKISHCEETDVRGLEACGRHC